MKSTKVQILGVGHALVYTEHFVGREEHNLSFIVCAVTASKEIYCTLAPLPYNYLHKF